MSNDIFFIQDESIVNEKIYLRFKDLIEPGDITKNKQGYTSKFVGFIFSPNAVLVSFPKNYFDPKKIEKNNIFFENENLLKNDTKLLFRVLQKTINKFSNYTLGMETDLNDNYPFKSFIGIYNYFLKYGLFTNEYEIKKLGYTGKIDWKNTLLKSPIITDGKNVLFSPLIIKKKISEYVFISKCMAYVINSTADYFSPFLNLKTTDLEIKDINWSNKKMILLKLREIKQTIFKDKYKRLVDDLILFFENENYGTGILRLKTRNFNLIWEEMVQLYLNKSFNGITKNGYIDFGNKESKKNFNFKKEILRPDKSDNKRTIAPDYYLISNNNRYIFDGKYYSEVKELNYKQIAYYFLTKHYKNDDSQLTTYNILILPTFRDDNDLLNRISHFDLKEGYNNDEKQFSVKEQYCNIKSVMKSYL